MLSNEDIRATAAFRSEMLALFATKLSICATCVFSVLMSAVFPAISAVFCAVCFFCRTASRSCAERYGYSLSISSSAGALTVARNSRENVVVLACIPP